MVNKRKPVDGEIENDASIIKEDENISLKTAKNGNKKQTKKMTDKKLSSKHKDQTIVDTPNASGNDSGDPSSHSAKRRGRRPKAAIDANVPQSYMEPDPITDRSLDQANPVDMTSDGLVISFRALLNVWSSQFDYGDSEGQMKESIKLKLNSCIKSIDDMYLSLKAHSVVFLENRAALAANDMDQREDLVASTKMVELSNLLASAAKGNVVGRINGCVDVVNELKTLLASVDAAAEAYEAVNGTLSRKREILKWMDYFIRNAPIDL